jgi:regulator of cell morphogenesis and NO signaling
MSTGVVIDQDMTVNEVIRQAPATVVVFSRYGIDACCGGGLPLAEAAVRHGHDVETLLAELRRTARTDEATA